MLEPEPNRIDLLTLDIDIRLRALWKEAQDVDEWNLEKAATFFRAAYGQGYSDALTEEEPGTLCKDNGYKVPTNPRKHLLS